ncbi:MAG: YbjN domain-containing protein [Chloracidobacterium sp.]|nr:YbjN domain-containing protein [Chloracidobacterium sp.]
MRTNKTYRLQIMFTVVSCLLLIGMDVHGQESHSQKVARVINETGFNFTKASEGVWTIPFEGKVQKDITVVISVSEDLLTLFSIVAVKKDFKPTPELHQKLLRFNDDLDRVKVGIDKDGDIFVRIDLGIRIMDKEELRANIDQVAAAADEVFKAVKPTLIKTK